MSTHGANPLPDNTKLPYSVIIRVGDSQDGFRGLLFVNVMASDALAAGAEAICLVHTELTGQAPRRLRVSTVLSGHHTPARAASIWFRDDLDL